MTNEKYKEITKKCIKEWKLNNPERTKELRRKSAHKRYHEDPILRERILERNRTYQKNDGKLSHKLASKRWNRRKIGYYKRHKIWTW
jgi:hypothetical protein